MIQYTTKYQTEFTVFADAIHDYDIWQSSQFLLMIYTTMWCMTEFTVFDDPILTSPSCFLTFIFQSYRSSSRLATRACRSLHSLIKSAKKNYKFIIPYLIFISFQLLLRIFSLISSFFTEISKNLSCSSISRFISYQHGQNYQQASTCIMICFLMKWVTLSCKHKHFFWL
jgi:hypothetical protein